VNSISPWIPISEVATRLSSEHLGHVSQPSPEPVSLTAPPVITMTTLMASAVNAASRTVRGCGVQRAAMKASGFRRAVSTVGTVGTVSTQTS
jgi:hypothetical protein